MLTTMVKHLEQSVVEDGREVRCRLSSNGRGSISDGETVCNTSVIIEGDTDSLIWMFEMLIRGDSVKKNSRVGVDVVDNLTSVDNRISLPPSFQTVKFKLFESIPIV